MPDTSEVTVICHPSDYSASSLARAVEDADASLLALVTTPDNDGSQMLTVHLRTNRSDPSPVVHSLERYGFNVTDAQGTVNTDASLAAERLSELQRYLNI